MYVRAQTYLIIHKKRYIHLDYNYHSYNMSFICESVFVKAVPHKEGLPMSGYWEYSISQTLYSHFEIGAARTITSISYRSMDTGVLTRSLDIYITPTSERTFSSSSPFVDVLAEQKVFSGDVTFQPDSWTTITFDVPYEYDGSKNLLITVDDNTGLAVTPYSMALAGTDIDFTLAQFNSTVDYDPLNLAAETPSAFQF